MRQTREQRSVTIQDQPLKGACGMTALIFLFGLINLAEWTISSVRKHAFFGCLSEITDA